MNRSVKADKAARVQGDTVTQSEWPVTTKALIADALKADATNAPTDLNQKVYSLIRLKVMLAHAQIQLGVASREHKGDEKVMQRLDLMKVELRKVQDLIPLSIR